MSIPLYDDFADPNGKFNNYDTYDAAQREQLGLQKHVDIRSFIQNPVTTGDTMFAMASLDMGVLALDTMSALTSGVVVTPGENWSRGTVAPQSDRNNFNGISMACNPGLNVASSFGYDYTEAIRQDLPSAYWRLDESGTARVAVDQMGTQPPNLITNPSFESQDLGPWFVDTTQGYSLSVSNAQAKFGSYSAFLTGTSTGGDLYAITINPAISCSPGETFTASVWMYLTQVISAAPPAIGLIFRDSLGFSAILSFPLAFADKTKLNQWQQVTLTGTAPDKAIGVDLYVAAATFNGTGTASCYIDGAMVVQGSTVPASFYEGNGGHDGDYNGSFAPNLFTTLVAPDGGGVPSFETNGVNGMVSDGTGTSVVQSSAQALFGSNSCRVTGPNTGGADVYYNGGAIGGFGGGLLPVSPNTAYTFSCYSRAATTGRVVNAAIQWVNASGVFLTTASGPNVTDSTTGWTRASCSAISPSNAAYGRAILFRAAGAANEQFYTDAWQLTQTANPVPYSDTEGVTFSQSGALASSGDTDTAVTFEGQSGYVVVPWSSAFQTPVFSVEAWIKPLVNGVGIVMSNGGTSSGGWLFWWNGAALEAYIDTTGAQTQFGSASGIVLNAWNHVVLTYDGTTARVYANGVQVASQATSYKTPTGSFNLGIGAWVTNNPAADLLNMSEDEVAVYNYAMSANQILTHYNLGLRNFTSTPVVDVSHFAPTDYLSLALPALPASSLDLTNTFLDLTSNPNGDFAAGPTDSLAFSSSLTALSNTDCEARFPLSSLTHVTLSDITGVRLRVTATSACTFRCLAIRSIATSWKYAPIDQNTLYDRITATVPPTGSITQPYTFPQAEIASDFAPYTQVVTSDDPVAYYRLDESGNARVAVDQMGALTPNLVTNPLTNASTPDGWSNRGGGWTSGSPNSGAFYMVVGDGAIGNSCMEYAADGTNPSNGPYFLIPGTFYADRTYTFSVYAKSMSGRTDAFILRMVGGLDATNGDGVTYGHTDVGVTLTGSWARYSLTWTPLVDSPHGAFVMLFQSQASAATWRMNAAQVVASASLPAFYEGNGGHDGDYIGSFAPNLAPNPSFATDDLTGWDTFNSTVGTGVGTYGAFKPTQRAVFFVSNAATYNLESHAPIAVQPNALYTFAAEVSQNGMVGGARNLSAQINWLDAGGGVISSKVTTFSVPTGFTDTRIWATDTSPANAVAARVYINSSSGASGDSWVFGQCQFTQTPNPVPYSDTEGVQFLTPNLMVGLGGMPSFESGITGMGPEDNGSVVQSSAQAFSGSESILCTAGSSGTPGVTITSTAYEVPVEPLRTYTWSAYSRAVSTGRGFHLQINYYDANGTFLQQTDSQNDPIDSSSNWVRNYVTGTAPMHAASAQMWVLYFGAPTGEQHYTDAWQFTQTSGPVPYNELTLAQVGALVESGDNDAAVQFDGQSGYAQVAASNALQPAQVSVEAWVYQTASSAIGAGIICSNAYTGGQIGYELGIDIGNDSFNRFAFGAYNGSIWHSVADGAPGASPVLANTWYHLVGTYDGATLKLYKNGVLVGSTAYSGGLGYQAANPLLIGRRHDLAGPQFSYFPGVIDEPAVYNYALSAAQVQVHYRQALNPPVASSNWPILYFSDVGTDEPRLVDIEAGAILQTGASTSTNALSLYFRESSFYPMPMSANPATLSSLQAETLMTLRLPMYALEGVSRPSMASLKALGSMPGMTPAPLDDVTHSNFIYATIYWGQSSQINLPAPTNYVSLTDLPELGGTAFVEIGDNTGVAYTLPLTVAANTSYYVLATLVDHSLRIQLYPVATNGVINWSSPAFDSTAVIDTSLIRRRRGRFGWYAQFSEGDAYLSALRPRRAVYGEYRSAPLRSQTPIDGVRLYTSSSPDVELYPTGGTLGALPRQGTALALDNTRSKSGRCLKVTCDGLYPLEGFTSVSAMRFENFYDTEVSFDVLAPTSTSLIAFLSAPGRSIQLYVPPIPASAWTHVTIPLETLGPLYQPGAYSLILVQGDTLANTWYIDNLSVSTKSVSWQGRGQAADPWAMQDPRWIKFGDSFNDPNNGALLGRGNSLQIRGQAVTPDAILDQLKILPKYAELGNFVWSDQAPKYPAAPVPSFNTSTTTNHTLNCDGSASSSSTPPPLSRLEGGTLGGLDESFGTIVATLGVLQYYWTFGDGNYAYGETVSHSYTAPGTYTVNLTVLDSYGQKGTLTRSVTVS